MKKLDNENELVEIEGISVFYGVDRALFKKGNVAMTTSAQEGAAKGENDFGMLEEYAESKNDEYNSDKNENSVACKELVFFVNSVKFIISVIKNLKLSKDEVNIIVANNEENQKIVKELGEGFSIGEIPLKGEPHKMLTFCTSTAYFGVDMYSESACTVVVSDIHNNNTSVDVASELLQIAGRQRNEANPFRNKILLIYNVSYSDVDEFKKKIDERWKRSKYELEYYKSLSGEERKDATDIVAKEEPVVSFKS